MFHHEESEVNMETNRMPIPRELMAHRTRVQEVLASQNASDPVGEWVPHTSLFDVLPAGFFDYRIDDGQPVVRLRRCALVYFGLDSQGGKPSTQPIEVDSTQRP